MVPFPVTPLVLIAWLSISLHHTWNDGTYYSYGWLVAPATACFFYRRWNIVKQSTAAVKPAATTGFIIAILIFIIFAIPVRAVQTIDVTWRPFLWIQACLVYGLCFFLLTKVTGWRQSCEFWPVAVLGFMAVPLPSGIENQLVGFMTEKVTDGAAFSLRWFGYPVQRAGSVLVSSDGVVEVGKACSGIRSFQAIIVAAWYFGELMWCRISARIILLVVGVAAAFVTNLLRAVILAILQFQCGEKIFHQWHDPIGFAAFGLAACSLLFIARWLESPAPSLSPNTSYAGHSPAAKTQLITVVSALLIVEGAVWLHFNFGKDRPGTVPGYSFPTENSEAFTYIDPGSLPEADILRFDDGGSGVFTQTEPGGAKVQMKVIYLEYDRGNSRLWMDLFAHAPEVCMRTVGADLEKQFPDRTADPAGSPVRFKSLQFSDANNDRVYIFKGFRLAETLPGSLDNLRQLRITLARHGKRSPAGRLFWAAVHGMDNEAAAWNLFRLKILDRTFPES